MRRKLRPLFWSATASAALCVWVLIAWLAQMPRSEPLSLVKGLRPDLFHPSKSRAFSRAVFYIRTDYDAAIELAKRELAGWDGYAATGGGMRWMETPGPFNSHGRQIAIRRNRIEPDSMAVLGSAADSKVWITIIVYSGLTDPNYGRGLVRLLTGNKNR